MFVAVGLGVFVGVTAGTGVGVFTGAGFWESWPLIPANRWYLFADPLTAPIYIYGYLDQSDTPRVGTEPVQGVDGVQISVVFDFGVGAVDWRGAWFNPGV